MATDAGVGDVEVPTLQVTPYDGTTTATLTVTAPDGTVTTPNVTSSDDDPEVGTQTWTGEAVTYDQAGRWVLAWTVAGTGASAEDQEVYVPAPVLSAQPADMLCAIGDLKKLLEMGDEFDPAKAALLIEAATAVVQEATDRPPQRIVLVEGDAFSLLGTLGSWLELPQRPVQSITSLTLDGETLAEGIDYKRFGSRLWRACGWQAALHEPSTIEGVYAHGYPAGSQELQLARSAAVSLIRGVYGNPEGAIQVRIDDYATSYARFSAAMEATEYLQRALQRQYGRPFGAVRLG